MDQIPSYRTLFRLPLSFFVTFAAVTGHIAASRSMTFGMLFTAAGVLLLACGASALNQYQERITDALMERTRRRPLPAGTITPRTALVLSSLLIAAGLGSSAISGPVPFFLGAVAILWYNGVYTPLKRRTPFAAVYGAPVGMLAPAIGWTAAGGGLADPKLFAISMVFFLWQVPHFWFLLLESRDDYERAGLSSLTRVFRSPRLARVATSWTVSAAAATLLLPLYGIVRSTPARAALLASAMLLTVSAYHHAAKADVSSFRSRIINTFIAAVMVLISADALFAR